MSNTPARVPFARTVVISLTDADLNFQRVESQQKGMFQPRVLVFGMAGSPSPYTVRATDWLILCDCTNGAITLTFPLAARLDGLLVTVVKTDASANVVTLSGTFNGGVNPTLAARYASKIVQAGNAVWYFTPTLSAADVLPGIFPTGTYDFSNATLVLPTPAFTPTIAFGGLSVGVTYAVQIGHGERVGNRYEFNLDIQLTSKGTSVGAVSINGLPIATNSTANNRQNYVPWTFALAAGATTAITASSNPADTKIFLWKFAAGASTQLQDTDVTNTSEISISGSYEV